MQKNLRTAIFMAAFVLVSSFPAYAARETLTVEQVLMEANKDRTLFGLPALKLDHTLNLAAFAKAEDMLAKEYFAHVSPEGVKPWQWFKALGYNYSFAGENLAIGFEDSEDLEQSWMNSPKHRANILSENYSDMGVAIVYRNGQKIIVQLFGSRNDHLAVRE
ncbi:MAG: CAP domain-containing protein [Candidatus Doudnabacteria bacterium]|nr:CAP domain-containing protein [Candidatus Doudnabacteria bacterium]